MRPQHSFVWGNKKKYFIRITHLSSKAYSVILTSKHVHCMYNTGRDFSVSINLQNV